MIYYIYDASSNVIGLKYNDDIYYYEKNIQNDITGITDDSFNLLATYEYDSWGNILSIKDTNGNTITDSSNIALVNPFRYRSYYYDSEIGMYYLNSRYYNSEWGRFINADGIIGANVDLISNNLYAYVSNNPINNSDPTGNWKLPNWAKISIGVIAVAAALVITVATGGSAIPVLIGAAKVVATTVAVSVVVKVSSNVAKTVVSGGGVKEIKQNALKGVDEAVADGVMWGGLSTLALVGTQAYLQNVAGSGINPGGNIQGMYNTPNTPGGTLYAQKFSDGTKFRVDLDVINGLHYHYGKGSAAKVHHIIVNWVFGPK